MKLKILKREKYQYSPEPEDYVMEWQFLLLEIGKFKINWLTDCDEWFCYIDWKQKWWRFSSAGYMSWKERL